jgi:hypothetical protein
MTKLSDPREELKTFCELRLIGVDVRQWITHLISYACLLLFLGDPSSLIAGVMR